MLQLFCVDMQPFSSQYPAIQGPMVDGFANYVSCNDYGKMSLQGMAPPDSMNGTDYACVGILQGPWEGILPFPLTDCDHSAANCSLAASDGAVAEGKQRAGRSYGAGGGSLYSFPADTQCFGHQQVGDDCNWKMRPSFRLLYIPGGMTGLVQILQMFALLKFLPEAGAQPWQCHEPMVSSGVVPEVLLMASVFFFLLLAVSCIVDQKPPVSELEEGLLVHETALGLKPISKASSTQSLISRFDFMPNVFGSAAHTWTITVIKCVLSVFQCRDNEMQQTRAQGSPSRVDFEGAPEGSLGA